MLIGHQLHSAEIDSSVCIVWICDIWDQELVWSGLINSGYPSMGQKPFYCLCNMQMKWDEPFCVICQHRHVWMTVIGVTTVAACAYWWSPSAFILYSTSSTFTPNYLVPLWTETAGVVHVVSVVPPISAVRSHIIHTPGIIQHQVCLFLNLSIFNCLP